MPNKRYDPILGKWDKSGKVVAKEIMRDIYGAVFVGENFHESDGTFKEGFWDLEFRMPDGTICIVEAEIKDVENKGWWGERHTIVTDHPFQYATVNIPHRKIKCKADIHALANPQHTYGFLVTREKIDASGKPIMKKTKQMPNGEPFFDVPCEFGQFCHKVNGKWALWKLEDRWRN
jgi:hypothetical protein